MDNVETKRMYAIIPRRSSVSKKWIWLEEFYQESHFSWYKPGDYYPMSKRFNYTIAEYEAKVTE